MLREVILSLLLLFRVWNEKHESSVCFLANRIVPKQPPEWIWELSLSKFVHVRIYIVLLTNKEVASNF